ncbi:hypothetical protein DAPPUDRAFT_337478 [Daphnia pulex]|uniref:Uncharacterized protein n=1 Tax=Daphnia pulex TaxID=6669 RepID=E9I1Q3_DAPPU|nr:hypothetical protein DAPPUDRAFT_337478 [Daphnia pulex]|eukprot:EFX62078.1 hypothetical protein DAPPUDRAFT_337478 [Daphnia pulex]
MTVLLVKRLQVDQHVPKHVIVHPTTLLSIHPTTSTTLLLDRGLTRMIITAEDVVTAENVAGVGYH